MGKTTNLNWFSRRFSRRISGCHQQADPWDSLDPNPNHQLGFAGNMFASRGICESASKKDSQIKAMGWDRSFWVQG